MTTRNELYEQVWTEPMSRLAKSFGISDVGLAKICKKNGIPVPPRGYWAKKQAGKKCRQTCLPPQTDYEIRIRPNPLRTDLSGSGRTNPARKQKHSLIVVPETLENPHPLTWQSDRVLGACPQNSQGILESPKGDCLDIRVATPNLPRALRVMDTLLKSLEHCDHEVALSKDGTVVKVFDVTLRIEIIEELRKRHIEPKEHDLEGYYRFGHNEFHKVGVPSGNLCLRIHHPTLPWVGNCRKAWKDTESKRLESCLNNIITGIETLATQTQEHLRRKEEREPQKREGQQKLEE